MLNRNKALYLLCLCYTQMVFSNGMGRYPSEKVDIFLPTHLWEFGGHALYIEANRAQFQLEQNIDNNPNLPWSWGFAVDASYTSVFGNDFVINWQHFRQEYNSQLESPLSTQNWTANNNELYSSLTLNYANTVLKPAWDQVNAEMGKTIQLGARNRFRFHGGINFSHVANWGSQLLEGQYQQVANEPTNFSHWQTIDESFNGFGLRTGVKLTHDFQNHFSLFIHAATSLLAGTEKLSQFSQYQDYEGTIGYSKKRILSELDGQLGTQYVYHLAEGMLKAEISWLWLSYFNAFTEPTQNFGLQGLYFGLQWSGDFV